jgi:peptidyl-prolyl cis-trans isomerase C
VRTLHRMLATGLVAILLAGCGPTPTGGAAATVDGDPIPRELLASQVRLMAAGVLEGDARERGAVVGNLQRRTLTLMIQARIIENVVAERGLEVSRSAIDARIEEELANFGGEDALEALLLDQGMTMVLFTDVLAPAQLHVQALRDELLEDLGGLETRTVRHILVETEDEAQDVVDELAAGADFGTLAEERSTDRGSAARGGDLGAAPRGAYVGPFDEAAWAADLDTVVGPVETDFGFHVLEVTAEDLLGPDELGADRIDQLVGPELNAVIQDAFLAADVEIGAGLGQWDPERAQVLPPDVVGEGAGGDVMAELGDLVEPDDQ